MNRKNRWIGAGALVSLYLASATASYAQSLTTLVTFQGQIGGFPDDVLVQGIDGYLYGTTQGGQPGGVEGTAFKMSTTGALTTLASLDRTYADAGMVQATNGNLYGTTVAGGAYYDGRIYQVSSDGSVTDVFSFHNRNGLGPVAGLIQTSSGKLLGTTKGGGVNGQGTVYEYTLVGTQRVLYSFCAQPSCTDGAIPYARLVQATDGNFYGTTDSGGNSPSNGTLCGVGSGCGTVFKLTPKGGFTTLYRFCSQPNCTDGLTPDGGLIQAADGYLYGMTSGGGAVRGGTIFRISLSGELTTLYSFCTQPNCTDGNIPYFASLFQATDGNFYGTTMAGGANNDGTIFSITPQGAFTTLHSFCSQPKCADGVAPYAGVMQATDGNFYGTTNSSKYDHGTVFMLSMGLGPFVTMLQTSGKVGSAITILGNNLTGATSVTFNGTPVGSFTVNGSGSAIFTTLPAGAATGLVRVTLADASVLTSNVVFRVK